MVLHLTTLTAFCRRLTIAPNFASTTGILGNRLPQYHVPSSRRTISSWALQMANEPLAPGAKICGQSGRTYTIQEVLAERREPLLCVYRARYDSNSMISSSDAALIIRSAEGQNFIVKNMIPGEYEYQQDLQKPLASCPNLRTVVDCVPDPELFIYPFLETNLLQFNQKNLTKATRRSMLKSALVGLAALHERNIIHTGRSSISLYLSFANRNYISRWSFISHIHALTKANRYKTK